ncbi:hypothetical protein HGRIS_012566 [Hohenbuehelia grisea]|uniref:BHLH domain-containing protein n=1 Tax=Hohenbuehelia grisea TaxID=104357 RepID=A0ABR3ISQ2_9AGAR
MAMTLPIPIPSSPSAGNSPASDDSNTPRTPVSPNMQSLPLPDQSIPSQQPLAAANPAPAQPKRKPSRRANTAERRATHNAVERQRRETLNGRFLDLAALLPNLSQIRRPSKSSIVNSSIAHIHASRRHRLLAARELRLVKGEADALRRELNEWRDRAGLPRVEEPVRGEGFTMVLSGELEVLAAVPGDDEDEDGQGYGGYDDGEDDYGNGLPSAHPMEDMDERRNGIAMIKNANPNPFAHNLSSTNGGLPHILPRPSQGPMIASSPTTVSFDPAMGAMYEPHYSSQHFMQQQHNDVDKVAAWNAAQLYMGQNQNQQQNLLQAQRSLFTPPATSHGLPANQQNNTAFNDQALFANFQRQQQQMAAIQQNTQLNGHMFGSPERDDVSSAGSVAQGRARSGSLGAGSGYGSPGHVSSPVGSYEMPSALSSGEYAIPRRMGSGAGLHVNTSAANGAPGSWGRDAELGGMGMMKQSLNTPPISVGGGGNGTGFAMMM